jgi:hypothetical protein
MKDAVIQGEPSDGRKASRIARRDRLDGAISEETGKFILAASGEEVAFVIFGACIAQ